MPTGREMANRILGLQPITDSTGIIWRQGPSRGAWKGTGQVLEFAWDDSIREMSVRRPGGRVEAGVVRGLANLSDADIAAGRIEEQVTAGVLPEDAVASHPDGIPSN